MTRDEVLAALDRLPPADRDAIRRLLNQRAENDAGHEDLQAKLKETDNG